MKKARYQRLVQFVIMSTTLSIFLMSTPSLVNADIINLSGYRFVAFIADDYDNGELHNVISWLQRRGGDDMTIAGPEERVSHSGGDVQVDILISEVNVSEFDCIIIPGGEGPANLIKSVEVLNKIRHAHSEGIILAAICHGPLVLAEAGVINETYVTGYADIRNDLTNAGGIYLDVKAFVDGNIVTGNTALYYKEFCYCIAKALGCLESVPPSLIGSVFDHIEEQYSDTLNISATITDDNLIAQVTAHLCSVVSSRSYTHQSCDLKEVGSNNYTGSFTIGSNGSYFVNIYVEDIYYNFITYENLTSLEVIVDKKPLTTEPEITEENSYFGLLPTSITLLVLVLLSRKERKTERKDRN